MPPRFRNKRDSFYRTALWRRDLARFLLFKQIVKNRAASAPESGATI